jgi:hypothetical protein
MNVHPLIGVGLIFANRFVEVEKNPRRILLGEKNPRCRQNERTWIVTTWFTWVSDADNRDYCLGDCMNSDDDNAMPAVAPAVFAQLDLDLHNCCRAIPSAEASMLYAFRPGAARSS